jgi:hypothetical protein
MIHAPKQPGNQKICAFPRFVVVRLRYDRAMAFIFAKRFGMCHFKYIFKNLNAY